MVSVSDDDYKMAQSAFSRAMEEGGPACMDGIIVKREAALTAFNDYLEAVEKHYFIWGYKQALDDIALKCEHA